VIGDAAEYLGTKAKLARHRANRANVARVGIAPTIQKKASKQSIGPPLPFDEHQISFASLAFPEVDKLKRERGLVL
jgi:hypothetical protein